VKVSITHTQHIVFFLYDGCQLLDYSGIAAVFEMANKNKGDEIYRTSLVCKSGEKITTSNGAVLEATDYTSFMTSSLAKKIDMFIVIGGEEEQLVNAVNDPKIQSIVTSLCERATLKCSICSGTFFLAITGQLNHKKATTHWAGIEKLRTKFPLIDVQDHVLYTMDEDTFTSAGVSTGIDLGLELISREHGTELSSSVAKRLVVSTHRPGNSSQIHQQILQQQDKHQQFYELCLWLKQQIECEVSVEKMAEFVHSAWIYD